MTVEFAAYLRTSTEESQSPEDSRRWQLSLAQQLIGPHQGRIVAVYHDIDVSRSLPWSRRPEQAASYLMLQTAAAAGRTW